MLTAGAGVYMSAAIAFFGNEWNVLSIIIDLDGYSLLGCGVLALGAFAMMVVNIARASTGYFWPAGLLVAALAFAAINVAVFMATMVVDAFAIFESAYMTSVALVGPGVTLLALSISVAFFNRLGWMGIFGFLIWIACVAYAHLWIIAAASASV